MFKLISFSFIFILSTLIFSNSLSRTYELDFYKTLNPISNHDFDNDHDENDDQQEESKSIYKDHYTFLQPINNLLFSSLIFEYLTHYLNFNFFFKEQFKLSHCPFLLFRPPNYSFEI